jgi:hypothetical protein
MKLMNLFEKDDEREKVKVRFVGLTRFFFDE